MSIFDEPKIDCHFHLFDPVRFPYRDGVAYAPGAHEQSSAEQVIALFDTYGVSYGLVVGPNSGYDTDSSPMYDLMERAPGRFKAVVVPEADLTDEDLAALTARGVVGVTFQLQLLGTEHLHRCAELLGRLRRHGLFADVQVYHDQLLDIQDLLRATDAEILVDHCGRPNPAAGIAQPGFAALLELADTGRVTVKISGLVKCSASGQFPYRDAWPYVSALVDAFGPDHLLWGSDWPYLRAPQRIDYGPGLALIEQLVPDPAVRHAMLWDNPVRLFGFGS